MPRMTLGSWLWEQSWVQRAVVTCKYQLPLEPILCPTHHMLWAARCAVVASLWSPGCCHSHQRLILGITESSRRCWHFSKEWSKNKHKCCVVSHCVTVQWGAVAEPATTGELANFCTCHETIMKRHWSIIKITFFLWRKPITQCGSTAN